MNTGITRFKKGNVVAKNKAGKKHLKTLYNESFKNSIQNLDGRLFKLTVEFLDSKNSKIKFAAWKELLKYRLSVIGIQKQSSDIVRWEVVTSEYGSEPVTKVYPPI